MTVHCYRTSGWETQVGLELVDSIVGAVDLNRSDEIDRLRQSLAAVGLDEAFAVELRLSGVPTVCDGECWGDVQAERAA